MAAPPDVTLRDLNGQYIMNKSLSDNIEPILILVSLSPKRSHSSLLQTSTPTNSTLPPQQGVSWFTRKAIINSTITLYVKEYTDSSNIVHIDIDQTGPAGIKGTTELRQLDWIEREHEDHIFGKVRGKNRWVRPEEIEDAFLKQGWLEETKREALHNHVESVGNGWVVDQVSRGKVCEW